MSIVFQCFKRLSNGTDFKTETRAFEWTLCLGFRCSVWDTEKALIVIFFAYQPNIITSTAVQYIAVSNRELFDTALTLKSLAFRLFDKIITLIA